MMSSGAPARDASFIPPEGRPPVGVNIVLGVQHVLSMFGATVLAPVLMGFDPNTAILMSGVATILFYVIVGGRVPSYLGSSFAFIAVVNAATGYAGGGPNPNIAIALGGIFAAGVVYTLIGGIVLVTGPRFLDVLFPPEVTGTVVAVIGLTLAGTAVHQIGHAGAAVTVAILTIVVICGIAAYAGGVAQRLPVLIGAVFGYIASFVANNVLGLGAPIDFAPLRAAAWIGLPQFHQPAFDPAAIAIIAPIALVLIVEGLGHLKAIAGMIDRNLDGSLGRAFIGDGIATMISAGSGGTGVTTYAENMGVMRLTRNFSSSTMLIAAAIAILLGFCPKFGAMVRTVPSPVLGALSIIIFGLITATAGAIWQEAQRRQKADFGDIRTLMTVGIPMVMASGGFAITIAGHDIGSVSTATLAALCLHHLLARHPTPGPEPRRA
jgi:uracil-xanthine permease